MTKGIAYRKKLQDKLVLVRWDGLKPEFTTDVFNHLYILNKTNINFMYQKILKSHIGTKEVVPAEGALEVWARGENIKFTIIEKKKVKKEDIPIPIGVGTICNIDRINKDAEIRFVLHPRFYGKGYTRLILDLLLKEAFEEVLLNNVTIYVIKDKKTYATSNAILKYARRVGVLLDYIEAEGTFKHVYIFQVTEDKYAEGSEIEE